MEKTLFDVLISISEILNKNIELNDILSEVLKITKDFVNAERLSIMLVNGDQLELTSYEGFIVDKDTVKIKIGEGISGTVIKTGKPIIINNSNAVKVEFGYKACSYLSVPIMTSNNIIGVLNITDKKGDYFNDDDIKLATFIANQCALSIERYKMYKELLRQERFSIVGKFTGAIAHDMRNLLNVINIYLDLIKLEKLSENAHTYLANIYEEIELIEGYISDILDFLKKKVFIRDSKFAITELLHDIERYMDIISKTKDVKFALDIRFNGVIKADKKKLYRVIINLLNNAIKATRKNPVIRITIFRTDKWLVINVFDNGRGIEADRLNSIFEPFIAFSNTGTGLGLAVAKDIIKDHGGDIKVHSKINKYTYFDILLPACRICEDV